MHFSPVLLLLSFIPCSLGVDICSTAKLTTTSGHITSPGYPNNYPANRDCVLTIELPLDRTITFKFTKIDMEEQEEGICYDSLTIKGIYEKEFCGSRSTPDFSPKVSVAKLTFTSDESNEQKGFDISYTSTPNTGLPAAISVCNTRTVNANVNGGRVYSPDFPKAYGNNINCKLTMNIPANKKTKITFNNVDIVFQSTCTSDRLVITNNKGRTKKVCGTGNANPVEFDGNVIHFHFIAATNTNDKRGFLLTYNLIDVAGGTLPVTSAPTTNGATDKGCACSPGNWYIKRVIPSNDVVSRATDDITVEFKTSEQNAMLFYAKGNEADFILLKIENGTLIYEVNLGTGTLTLNSIPLVSDNNWHKVIVARNGRSVTVTIDDLNQISGTTPGSFSLLDLRGTAALYALGGYNAFDYTFKGCVKNMVIDGMKPNEAIRNNEADYSLYGTNGTPLPASTMGACT